MPSPAAKSLSRAMPQYLTRLANEPSEGLHHVGAHAQRRAVPALASAARGADRRRDALHAARLDANDAVGVLEELDAEAGGRLQRIEQELREAAEKVRKKTVGK